jgi:hypothetical protein
MFDREVTTFAGLDPVFVVGGAPIAWVGQVGGVLHLTVTPILAGVPWSVPGGADAAVGVPLAPAFLGAASGVVLLLA